MIKEGEVKGVGNFSGFLTGLRRTCGAANHGPKNSQRFKLTKAIPVRGTGETNGETNKEA